MSGIDWRRIAEKGWDLVRDEQGTLGVRVRTVQMETRRGREWLEGSQMPPDLERFVFGDTTWEQT